MKADNLHTVEPKVERICQAVCAMTDAEGYTSVAEDMDPPRLVKLVNSYLRALFKPVLRNGGRVLDVKGDGVLAVWARDAADAAMRARVCRGCMQMIQATDRSGLAASRLPTRVGVDFGPIALAKVGAFARYEYRAVGDTVNTSSRLEQLNKELGTRILVSQAFAEGVEGFLFRDLGSFTLRGKRSPLRVLELVAAQERATPAQRERCAAFAAALAALEGGRSGEAVRRFAELCARFPDDGPSRYYLGRCTERHQPGAAPREPFAAFVARLRYAGYEQGTA